MKNKIATQTVNIDIPFPQITIAINGRKYAYGYKVTTN
jgi:hypothetical protein